jgi:hypothetical protein
MCAYILTHRFARWLLRSYSRKLAPKPVEVKPVEDVLRTITPVESAGPTA